MLFFCRRESNTYEYYRIVAIHSSHDQINVYSHRLITSSSYNLTIGSVIFSSSEIGIQDYDGDHLDRIGLPWTEIHGKACLIHVRSDLKVLYPMFELCY